MGNQTSKINVTVEGNIGAGKSTFLKVLKQHGFNILQEPLSEWIVQNPDGTTTNVLKEFYKDPEKNAYVFQSFCLRSRCKIMKTMKPDQTYLLERGLHADGIFAATQYEEGRIRPLEYSVYLWELEEAKKDTPSIHKRIYIRTSPETCLRRVKERNREGEENITLEYLNLLHTKHEEWLATRDDGNILLLEGIDYLDEATHEQVVEKVRAFIV